MFVSVEEYDADEEEDLFYKQQQQVQLELHNTQQKLAQYEKDISAHPSMFLLTTFLFSSQKCV